MKNQFEPQILELFNLMTQELYRHLTCNDLKHYTSKIEELEDRTHAADDQAASTEQAEPAAAVRC
jgi:hypothetical protein